VARQATDDKTDQGRSTTEKDIRLAGKSVPSRREQSGQVFWD
jgi:hypothetical protein